MAKTNVVNMYARVHMTPSVSKNLETGVSEVGMVYLDTVRSLRPVGDKLKYTRHDYPLLISREPEHINTIESLKINNIVYIKGVITTQSIEKKTHCQDPNCGCVNVLTSNLTYITPIFMEKVKEYTDEEENANEKTKDAMKEASIEDLLVHREISCSVQLVATLIRNPKMFTTKKGLQITQYPVATNRKFTIRTDAPEIRTDWPMVKTYGEKAIEDKMYLSLGCEILIDGFLQARYVERTIKCKECGKEYKYRDHCMEIVPYDVEYLKGHKSKEEVEEEYQADVEAIKQKLFDTVMKNDLEDDTYNSTDIL